jgi:ABC-type transport system involved in multi-copper enzyme maturation permease subunit
MSDDKDAAQKRPESRRGWIPILVAALFILAAGVIIGRAVQPASPWHVYFWAAASLFFGALVGLSEILSRYRDEPILASTTAFGLAYLVLNGLISLGAFAVLCKYASAIFPAVRNDLFLTSVIAGFGGMTVFRSKLFTFRSSDGKDYPIGPAIVLETVLSTIDHKIDRRRASERQAKVVEAMSDLTDFENTAKYIEASLNSFQNLTTDDKAQISSVIDQYRRSTWPDRLKIMAMGFAFLNVAGEENFDEVTKNIRDYLASLKDKVPPQSPSNVIPPPSPGPQTL